MFGLEQVSLLAVVIAAALGFFTGFLWYSPLLFGNIWGDAFTAKEKITKDEMEMTPWHLVGGFIVALVMALGLASLLSIANIATFGAASQFVFVAWLGLIATTHFSSVIWAKKPLIMYFVDAGWALAVLLVMSWFFVWWG